MALLALIINVLWYTYHHCTVDFLIFFLEHFCYFSMNRVLLSTFLQKKFNKPAVSSSRVIVSKWFQEKFSKHAVYCCKKCQHKSKVKVFRPKSGIPWWIITFIVFCFAVTVCVQSLHPPLFQDQLHLRNQNQQRTLTSFSPHFKTTL